MTLIRTGEPGAEPVSVAELKQYLRIGHDSEDDLLGGLVRAARDDLERATGLALIEQSWRLALDHMPKNGIVLLARGPVRSIEAVTFYGADGTPRELAPSEWQADLVSRPARLLLPKADGLRAMNGIEVEFTCGFGEAGPDVPDVLRRAIMMLAPHCYEFRASYGTSDQPVSYPAGYERMISHYIERRI